MHNLDPRYKDRAAGPPGWQVPLLSSPAQARGLPVFTGLHQDASKQSGKLRHPSKGASQVNLRIYLGMRESLLQIRIPASQKD